MNAAAFDASGFGPLLEMEGTVAAKPVVRTLPMGEAGEPMPVLCLKVHQVGPHAQRSVTCNQVFPIGQHAAAHARAAQLKPGMRIKVQVALDLMECHFPVTAHIHAVQTPATQTQEAVHA
jgi:hypothetical protein